MKKIRKRKLVRAFAGLSALLLIPGTMQAQRRQGGGPRGQGVMGMQQRQQGQQRGVPAVNDQHAHRPGFMERLRDLPPEEQERVLSNDNRFRHLPPERQERIRENLRRWNALSPEAKQRIREREQAFVRLSPRQREGARALAQQWRELPPGRRLMLRQAFRRLRDLPPGQRERFLQSPQIERRFSAKERRMLRGLGSLLPEGQEPDSSDLVPEAEDQ